MNHVAKVKISRRRACAHWYTIKFLSFSRYRGKKFRQIRYDRYATSKSRQVTGVNYPTGTRRGRGYSASLGRQYRYPPKSGSVKHFHAKGLLRMPLRLDKNRFSNRESSYSRGASLMGSVTRRITRRFGLNRLMLTDGVLSGVRSDVSQTRLEYRISTQDRPRTRGHKYFVFLSERLSPAG